MSLPSLPNEMLFDVIERLDLADRNALVRTSRLLYNKLNLHLYTQHIQHSGGIGLLWAARYGRIEAFTNLLEHGANPNLYTKLLWEIDDSGMPPIRNTYYHHNGPTYTMVCSSTTKFKCIIPMPEAYDYSIEIWTGLYNLYDTALNEAVSNDESDIAKILLARDDVDINFKNTSKQTAPHLAAERGNIGILAAILQKRSSHMDISAKDRNGSTPLGLAIQHHQIDTVQFLLSQPIILYEPLGTLLDAQEMGMEMEPLQNNIVKGNLRISGAQSAIEHVIEQRSSEILKVILAHPDVDPDHTGNSTNTPLTHAVIHERLDMANLLLATSRVDVNARDQYGNTPLIYAAGGGKRNMVKLLLSQEGIIRYPKNNAGETPAQWAMKFGNATLARFLEPNKRLNRELEYLLQDYE